MAEKGGTSHGGLTEKLSPFFYAQKQEVNAYVTHTNSGEGLLFFGNTTIPFVDRFPQNTELYAIMTTRPEDKKQEMKRA
ncbi:hypothetical protein BACCAP_04334 [Pseudoflavonifractor capillosus ATCC 29799]|uniref:Uncharacterized protein n=1 Tax=Pseudoflavonifractor capillosus ATCC 29799 TaxID=411467 RepID=A6P1G6_9FIRM|nr:hypothetical protein BACCAP_04334 [Pseudoflavonifractor capillosus ATCC 29799]